MIVRDAIATDVDQACAVLRASIAELCMSDHNNDPDILGRWLANKTPDTIAAWMREADNSLLVAIENDAIVAVGSIRNSGEIALNYVAPSARFRGVSTALLETLEARAAARGVARVTLLSTETAHRFYLARGYRNTGPPQRKFGTTSSYPMEKMLSGLATIETKS